MTPFHPFARVEGAGSWPQQGTYNREKLRGHFLEAMVNSIRLRTVFNSILDQKGRGDADSCRQMFSKCSNTWEAYLGLVALSGCGSTQVGSSSGVLSQTSTTYGFSPVQQSGCPLPLDPVLVEAFLSASDRSIAGGRASKEFLLFSCLGIAACWIFLFCAGWSDDPVDLMFSKSVDLTRKLVLDRYWVTVDSFLQ